MLAPTAIIDRHYQILSSLGSGLSGEVYRVKGPEGIAALKLLKTEVPGIKAEEHLTNFKFEFSLLKGLSHPNIVKIFDFGFDGNLERFYFTEELVEGTGLLEFSKQARLDQIQELFLQALQGLSYLHAHDVIHGDLKPENLLITSFKDPPLLKMIDFGISHPSLVGFAGTPAYLAPEKILKEPSNPKSDLYSLAVVFYTALTGKNPFWRKNVLATLQAHLKFTPPSATAQRPELDPVFSELLALMMKKNPRHRIESAEACLKFLETRGAVQESLKKPRVIPQHWVGRSEILLQARDFLKKISKETSPHWLLIVGEKGLGKGTLLTELKYEAELMGIEVLSPTESPSRKSALYFVLDSEGGEDLSEKVASWLGQASVLLAMDPEAAEKIKKGKTGPSPQTLRLRPLNQKETETYLQEVTRNKKIPAPFLNSLLRLSRGYPSLLNEALQNLLKDPLIVDASGKWNLAVFQEAEPTLEQLGLSESSLAQALADPRSTDPAERFHLNSQRALSLAHQGRLDESLQVLNRLEGELGKIFARPERLLERSSLLGNRGWIYTKQSRYQEAREAFASALSLLRESENPSPVLSIRFRNFMAFLDLQEGRLTEAIAEFQKTADEAQTLPENERRKITNNELGQSYLAAGRIPEAIEQLQKDLNFFATLSDPSFRMKAGYNLAEALSREENYPEAIQAYQQVAEIARESRDWEYLLRAYNGLGNTAFLKKDFSTSLDYYQRSLNLAEYLRDFLSAATVAQNRGTILSESGRLEESFQSLELSKQLLAKVHPSSHSRYLMARATLELGEVFKKMKDLGKAKSYFTEALNRSEEDPNLKSFSFYPLYALAGTALEEKDGEAFREIYPRLVHVAKTPEEKEKVEALIASAPAETPPPRAVHETTYFMAGPFPQEAFNQVLKVNRALIHEREPSELFRKILEYATELSGAESALLLELSEDDSLQVLAAFNTTVDQGQKEMSEKIARQVLSSGESLITADAQTDDHFNQYESVVALHLRSIACFPIRLQQRVIGLLYLTHRYQPNLFTPEKTRVLEAFSDQAGLALQNARFVRQLTDLNQQLKRQLETAEEEIDRLKTDLRSKVKNPYPKILGKSRAIVEILQSLDRISDTNLTVLILGETGSGKELVARAIHENSRRRKAAFVAVNCGAIPDNLIESELFGYKAGAFTGAQRDKKGLLEEASGGTLFLDEIAELPMNMQVKLLRALQEKEIRRLGDTQATPIDLRIVSATHRNLETWMAEGKFREDLYYRIAQMILSVPPLRERKEDLLLLSEHFLGDAAKELGLDKAPRIDKALLKEMMEYDWPGNVRELENLLRTASAFAERGLIHPGNLPVFLKTKLQKGISPLPLFPSSPSPILTPSPHPPIPPSPLPSPPKGTPSGYHPEWKWSQYEEALYAKSFLRHGENCEKVAQELGVGIATVYVKVRRYGLKNNAGKWQDSSWNLPPHTTVNDLKKALIQESYQRNQQSPYAVAKQLGLNVGTIYRYLS